MRLFDENEHYTDEAIQIKKEFNDLIEDFVKNKCSTYKTMDVQLCCKHVLDLICTVERIKGFNDYDK